MKSCLETLGLGRENFASKEVQPIGVAPEQIRVALVTLLEDVKAQIQYKSWHISEIAARFHHRLVAIHPFPNGNGRFSRTMADLLLIHSEEKPFEWGAGLEKEGEARKKYIAALQAADRNNYRPLFDLVGVQTKG